LQGFRSGERAGHSPLVIVTDTLNTLNRTTEHGAHYLQY